MASAVTITPDAAAAGPVTITPDAQRSWFDSVSDFGKELWKQVNPVAGVKGAAQLTSHPIDTLKSDADARQQVYDNAENAFKKGNYTEGAAHLLYAVLPFVGPQLDQAANNFQQGNYAKGAGTSVGMGLSMAGPDALKNLNLKLPGVVDDVAQKIYKSTLKPAPASYTPAETARMVNTGLENKIPISAKGLAKLQDLTDDLNTKVADQIKAGNQAGLTVNKFSVASRLSDTANRFKNQVTPMSDLDAIGEAGNEFLESHADEIPVSEAQSMKAGTYTQLRGKYGELSSATTEAQKGLARGIKEELENHFPEVGANNGRLARNYELEGALERAVNRTTNHNIFGLGGQIISAGGATAGAALGGAEGAGIGAASGMLLQVLRHPEVQSRLAFILHSASKGSLTLGAAQARVAGFANAVGNAAMQQQQSPQPAFAQ